MTQASDSLGPEPSRISSEEMVKRLKSLQDQYQTANLAEELYDQFMLKHGQWAETHGNTTAALALQEVFVAVIGRITSMAKDPIQVIQTFEQLLLNTVAYYVNRQTRRVDQLQILSGLMSLGAMVQSVSEEQRKTLS